jgi:hypothetical protein
MNAAPVDPRRRWWRPLERADRLAMMVMVLVPTIIFVVPALTGHPAIQADNLIQNFPLRVLSGRQLASGHLPLLNPYSNSGTPLLGGLNAGALYPMTVIFAFIPAIAAWLLNLIVIYVTAALGMFCLLRWHGLRTLASFAAAMSFAYTGAMIGQVVHLGVVQGFSFIPWTLLILLSLSRQLGALGSTASWRRCARTALPATMGFAVIWGLTFLTGEPRAIAVIELLCIVVIPVVLLVRTSYSLTVWRTRVTYVVALAVGLFWGAALGLVQLLPGHSFIAISQRASTTYGYFGAGSLAVRWTPLLLDQDMFGGNGMLGQPRFFNNYNLAEVTGYAGLLVLVATFAFLTRLTRRGWVGPQRDYVLYLILFIVGLFAAWGSFTPLGHLFQQIPLFGSTRLQSRNIIVVDFAGSVLLGWWLDRIAHRDLAGAGVGRRARWLTLLPAFFSVALSVVMLVWGTSLVHRLGASSASSVLAKSEVLSLFLHLAIALAVIAVLWWWSRSQDVTRWLMIILSADVLFFLLFSSTGLIGTAPRDEPSQSHAVALMGDRGRIALVDLNGVHTRAYNQLGLANLNVFTRLKSVQGYGSLIATSYDDATGTHPLAELNPCRLADGTFTQLRLASLAVSSSQLSTSLLVGGPPTTSCIKPTVTTSTNRYFGRVLDVDTVSLRGYAATSVSAGPVTLRLLNSSGRPVGATLTQPGAPGMNFTFPAGVEAAGFVVHSNSGLSIYDATVSQATPDSASFRLDTPFAYALSTSAWRLTKTVGTFSIFSATHLRKPDWLVGAVTGTSITHTRTASWGDSWVSVTASSPVVLVRSEAYLPGWRATALNEVTGKSRDLHVTRSGLVQKVTVPKGKWTVHFHYHAPYIELSVVVTFVSLLALLVAAWWLRATSRKALRAKVRS